MTILSAVTIPQCNADGMFHASPSHSLAASDTVAAHTFAATVSTQQTGTNITAAATASTLHIGIVSAISAASLSVDLIHCGLILLIGWIHLNRAGKMIECFLQPSPAVQHSALEKIPFGIAAFRGNSIKNLLRIGNQSAHNQVTHILEAGTSCASTAATASSRIAAA